MLTEKQTQESTGFVFKNLHKIILASSFLLSLFSLVILYKFGAEKVTSFGPKAKTYFIGIKIGLIYSTLILFISLIFSLFFEKYLIGTFLKIESSYNLLENGWKNLLILVFCFVFLFVS